MKKLTLSIFLILPAISSFSQSGAGDAISYNCLGGLQYQFTFTVWGDSLGTGDSLLVNFGDNTYFEISASSVIDSTNLASVLGVNYSHYNQVKWQCTHTFPGPGIYNVIATGVWRQAGVANCPNSRSTKLEMFAFVNTDPMLGANSSPVFSNARYIYFPVMSQPNSYTLNATDPDGDSLSYSFQPCNVSGYSYPDAMGGGTLSIDSATGQFSWDNPTVPGYYNTVIRTQQWHHFPNGSTVFIASTDQEIEFIVDASNGIPHFETGEMRVFPNPASDFFTVKTTVAGGTFILTDQLGREVKEVQLNGEKQVEISVADLAGGMYFYTYLKNGERLSSGKIVVER